VKAQMLVPLTHFTTTTDHNWKPCIHNTHFSCSSEDHLGSKDAIDTKINFVLAEDTPGQAAITYVLRAW
jgi:hypothetical protein